MLCFGEEHTVLTVQMMMLDVNRVLSSPMNYFDDVSFGEVNIVRGIDNHSEKQKFVKD